MVNTAELIVAVRRGGQVEIGPGITIGDVLAALDLAQRTVLGVTLNPRQATNIEAEAPAEAPTT